MLRDTPIAVWIEDSLNRGETFEVFLDLPVLWCVYMCVYVFRTKVNYDCSREARKHGMSCY